MRKLEDELARVRKKLANEDFLNKAKEEVVLKERDKAGQYGRKDPHAQSQSGANPGISGGKS